MDGALLTSEPWKSTSADDELMSKQLNISLFQNVHDQEYSLLGTKSENYHHEKFCFIVFHIKHKHLQHEDGSCSIGTI